MDVPHVVILPFPVQGHIKPMLMLAELLCHAGVHVTFVNSDHNHDRVLRSIDKTSSLHGLRFMSIPDGLPPEHPRAGLPIIDLFFSTSSTCKPKFKDLVVSLIGRETGRHSPPPTCIIADGIMSFAIDVAEELEIPIIAFRTYSACSTWTYFHIAKLIEEGEVPFPGGKDMDRPITCIPGFESLLRRRDLPHICRFEEVGNPVLQFFITVTSSMTRASALLLNTFHELEAPIIGKLSSLFPRVYAIGPLHALLKSRIRDHPPPSDSGSLRPQDRKCLTWLDSQPSKSVIYVSFGSVIFLTRDQLFEFWYGLVKSGKSFLWVMRPDLIKGEDGVGEAPEELMVGTKERGCMVEWAPQEEVLAHWAIGGFLTHSGWNSTLESILEGVPMICWPQWTDQQINSRCVSELWGIGLDMKDTCDRSTVEMMVRDLMENKKTEEIRKSTAEIARMACDSVREGGSSRNNLEKLIEDMKSFNLPKLASQKLND